MRVVAVIFFIFMCNLSYAQERLDSIFYDFNPRYYNTNPCGGCPTGGNKINIKENDKNSPYHYKDPDKPIVLKVSDSLLQEWIESEVLKKVEKETEPIL